MGFLGEHGLKIQRRRAIGSLQRVDRLGRALRKKNLINRQEYKVKRPNALWHGDGCHKLILWGYVIHAFVDGFSRTVRIFFFSITFLLNLSCL
ncbi:hypothetical protein C8R41DRAFT_782083 [Lentinula lateritia]|uniref:Integrase core domain-containing protein n=1 Tax=Lentinula lateritia TaxID=40482 RepID=A0ABQ8UXR7_9AGAR|nr:hypothetical protein C8R41DRAFT_782083 [Lentinula lateritia]